MKRLEKLGWREKTVMALIILSCGFASHTDPGGRKAIASGLHKWHVIPTAEAAAHPAKVTKAFAAPKSAP